MISQIIEDSVYFEGSMVYFKIRAIGEIKCINVKGVNLGFKQRIQRKLKKKVKNDKRNQTLS